MTGVYFDQRKELRELKQLLGEYGVLATRQLYAYFHYKSPAVVQNIMGYMSRGGMIAVDDDLQYAALTKAAMKAGADQKLIASFWVLLDSIQRIEYHARAAYPSQLFLFMDGAEFEVLYAALGDEALISSVYSKKDEDTRYFVVVEQPEQIETLEIPRVEWFCTVAEDGKLEKYIQEDETP